MRFLIDNAISPMVSQALSDAGHDSFHLRDRGLQASPDTDVMDLAVAEGRIVVSADTDFGTLMATRGATAPSVIVFRHGAEHRPDRQARMLLANLQQVEHALAAGAIVAIEPSRIRVRRLPLI